MKIKNRILIISILLLNLAFLMQSCEKEEKNSGVTTYYGRVLERNSDVGVPDCIIYIHEKNVSNPWGGSDMPVVTHTYSDSSGGYSVTFTAESGKDYYIYPECSTHGGYSRGHYSYQLKTFGKSIHKDLEQWPLAFVKIKMLNRKKYSDFDLITFGSNKSGSTVYPGSKDSTYIVSVWGNIQDNIMIYRHKGINIIHRDNFLLNIPAWQFDSLTYEY